MWNRGNAVEYSDPSGYSPVTDFFILCNHQCDPLAVKATIAMYDAAIGDDIKTLRGNASAGAKGFALGMIVMDFTGWSGIERIAGKSVFAITRKGVTHLAERHLIGVDIAPRKVSLIPARA